MVVVSLLERRTELGMLMATGRLAVWVSSGKSCYSTWAQSWESHFPYELSACGPLEPTVEREWVLGQEPLR